MSRLGHSAVPAPSEWQGCSVDELDGLLSGWSLVEFWAPDNLFGRLLAPVRVQFARTHAARLRLLCCVVDRPVAAWGVDALPALVLFRAGRRVRRWLGAIEPSLLAHGIGRAMDDAAA